jgi:serine/threonine protein phosphatase 1
MSEGPQTTPARVAGELVYAIGDIHGCYDLLKDLLARVAADAASRARGRRPVMIFLGDYVDRGPQSAQVMDALVWLRRRSDLEIHFLKGNHEQALLEFLDAPERGGPWLSFGGAETLISYGVEPPEPDAPPATYRAACEALLERMPAGHLKLLQQLETMVVVGDYAFVHAGVRPGAPLEEQAEEDLLWIRRGFLDQPGPFPKIIVHGHTWLSEQPQLCEHRLGIDTGAFATGVLTAARLEDGEMEMLQARRADVRAAERALA